MYLMLVFYTFLTFSELNRDAKARVTCGYVSIAFVSTHMFAGIIKLFLQNVNVCKKKLRRKVIHRIQIKQ